MLVDRACAAAAPAHAQAPASGTGQPAGGDTLSPGACLALGPTGPSRGRTVFVDPGHGGPDPGVVGRAASGQELRESAVALAVATDLAGDLRADGYRVVLSRSGDTSVLRFLAGDLANGLMSADQVRQDLRARVRCANRSAAAALLSIHFNGYSDSSAQGAQTIYDAVRPFAARSRRLAEGLQSALVSRAGLADRGLETDDQLQAPVLSDQAGSYGHLVLLGPPQPGWLDQGTTMPGALVESMFLTSPADAALVSTAAGRQRLAAALEAGLRSYLATT
ncbi:MAG TPA: N-acetylmuramoyl-L-alanine amidase [Candidatus Dormibacteraeota bacterium]|nr:N-acetylmuramoyl-L-alanine amidase [Candidatus Dormibacteraeota bacterium]